MEHITYRCDMCKRETEASKDEEFFTCGSCEAGTMLPLPNPDVMIGLKMTDYSIDFETRSDLPIERKGHETKTDRPKT